MDSPAVTQLFRQLFRHRPCQSGGLQSTIQLSNTRIQNHDRSCRAVRAHSTIPSRAAYLSRRAQRRSMSGKSRPKTSFESNWQQRTDVFPLDMSEEYKNYPVVTADQLRGRRERPKRVKMLMRDFIEDSLYNPSYGYFSKQAVIFSPGEPFDFNSLKDENEFHSQLGQRYIDFEDKLDVKETNDTRQLWHTPTELFRPYYGEAIARHLLANYKLIQYPYHDLIIYEMGAGNGTLMLNVLDYIRDMEPVVYERTKYKIIEISSNLAALQANQLLRNAASRGHHQKVEIINKSIFAWQQIELAPCYFLAMEVFDNFAHDSIRYDPQTEEPLQGTVLIDSKGDFYDFYVPQLDPVAARFIRVRDAATGGRYPHPLPSSKLLRHLRSRVPFMPNLSDPEYIPTRLMQFFDILGKYFPQHKLITSDFHSLPDTVKGVNAPVVQTRYQRRTVPVSTPLVHQGYFDILFPTNFTVMEQLYRAITGNLTRVSSHEDYLKRWADVQETETKNGDNPLLSWYKNASVMVTV